MNYEVLEVLKRKNSENAGSFKTLYKNKHKFEESEYLGEIARLSGRVDMLNELQNL